MDAPGVASGKIAGDTVLANTAVKTASEKEGNTLEEYVPAASPKSNLGGEGKH